MIRFVILTEWAIFALGVWFIVFQITVPFLTGTPFFPILRHKKAKALADLAEAYEEREINAIKAETTGLSVGKDRKTATKGAK